MQHPGGIEPRYRDALGRVRRVPDETMRRLQAALGESAPADDAVRVVRPAQRVSFAEPADLLLENGLRESLPVARGRSRLPEDVPLGYHTVELSESGRRVSLIVAPDKCHLPDGLRIWAWAVQLYSLRSRRSWGMGDFGDLAAFAKIAQRQGSRLLLVHPLHAASPTLPQQPSAYSPTTRRYQNPLYLACESVAGARELPEITRLLAAGRALTRQPLIDRDGIFTLKRRALGALYARLDADSYRSPRSADVRRYAQAHAARVRFHQWIQWHLDRQLRHAASLVSVMQDLPIGMDPQGAYAWAWQHVLAEGIHVGAPPDEFNTKGQDWGLPPFTPARLKAAAYRPFVETIRRTYVLLARAPSVVVTSTLEDATATDARPNMPGTVSEWPNWKQPLPTRLEALARDPTPRPLRRRSDHVRPPGRHGAPHSSALANHPSGLRDYHQLTFVADHYAGNR